MGQLKAGPFSNVRQMQPLRPLKGLAGDRKVAAGDVPQSGLDRLKLSPAHIELIKACAENLMRKADGPPASQMAQRFAPAADFAREPALETVAPAPSPSAPFNALAASMRKFTLIVLVAALLPNLTAAAFWFGLVAPWPEPASPASEAAPAAASASLPPALSAPDLLEAREGQGLLFPIALDGTDGVPPGSVIVVRGLPRGSAFSAGQAQGETEWNLKRDQIGELALALPVGSAGEYRLTLQLLAPNNGILADASTSLKVAPDREARLAALAGAGPAALDEAEAPHASSVPDDEMTGAVGGEESDRIAANEDAAMPEADAPPPPARRPKPEGSQGGKADWVRPTAHVNLRDAPSPSGKVLGTIAKGAKLKVLDRQRGWLKVASPEDAKSGWVYSGNTTVTP